MPKTSLGTSIDTNLQLFINPTIAQQRLDQGRIMELLGDYGGYSQVSVRPIPMVPGQGMQFMVTIPVDDHDDKLIQLHKEVKELLSATDNVALSAYIYAKSFGRKSKGPLDHQNLIVRTMFNINRRLGIRLLDMDLSPEILSMYHSVLAGIRYPSDKMNDLQAIWNEFEDDKPWSLWLCDMEYQSYVHHIKVRAFVKLKELLPTMVRNALYSPDIVAHVDALEVRQIPREVFRRCLYFGASASDIVSGLDMLKAIPVFKKNR